MAFSTIEIIGLAVLVMAVIMQISAVGTLKWRNFELASSRMDISVNYGLFNVCVKRRLQVSCSTLPSEKTLEAAYNTVKATTILSILDLSLLIAVIIIYKVFLKINTLQPTIIIGLPALMFGMITVIVYATSIKYEKLLKLGNSFYVSCAAVALIFAGIIIHGIGARNSE